MYLQTKTWKVNHDYHCKINNKLIIKKIDGEKKSIKRKVNQKALLEFVTRNQEENVFHTVIFFCEICDDFKHYHHANESKFIEIPVFAFINTN